MGFSIRYLQKRHRLYMTVINHGSQPHSGLCGPVQALQAGCGSVLPQAISRPGTYWDWLLRLIVALIMGVLLALGSNVVLANEAQIQTINPVARDGKLYLDADIQLDISGDLRNAARKGIPIHFTADAEIVSRRWWWFDKVVARKQVTWRIVYNALTRQWRVGAGDLSLPETSLDDALSRVRHIRGWVVADLDDINTDQTYDGRLRLRLDTSLLARPFQIDALNSSVWSLSTPWKNFSFSISEDARPH